MITYMTKIADAKLAMSVLDDFIADGAIVHTDRGSILVCHGSPDGDIKATCVAVAKARDLPVSCCYPARVQKRHPELTILGDWDIRTQVAVKGDEQNGVVLTLEPLL